MESVISIITSLIGCVTLFVKTFFGKSQKREKGYYEKVLKPYALEVSKNKKLRPLSIVKSLADRNDDDIPKYIFYLLDNEQEEELNKVLIYDYWSLYPNDDNTVYKVVDGFMKLVYYLLFFMALYSIVYGILYVLTGFSGVLLFLIDLLRNGRGEGGIAKGILDILKLILIGICCLGVGVGMFLENTSVNEDRYDIKTKKMTSMIKRKVRRYDKSSNKFMV